MFDQRKKNYLNFMCLLVVGRKITCLGYKKKKKNPHDNCFSFLLLHNKLPTNLWFETIHYYFSVCWNNNFNYGYYSLLSVVLWANGTQLGIFFLVSFLQLKEAAIFCQTSWLNNQDGSLTWLAVDANYWLGSMLELWTSTHNSLSM